MRLAATTWTLLLCLGISSAQQAPRLYAIAGTVTNLANGEALPGTTVTLSTTTNDDRHSIRTTLTDSGGHFDLPPVPAGKYDLSAARRGYTTSAYDEHEGYNSAIVTGDDQDTEHLRFQIHTGAMVRGIVTDDAGEPAPNANVMLMYQTRQGGLGDHLVKSISGSPDDTGLFEFWDLAPGNYFLAVTAEPWFAVHPTHARPGSGSDDLDVAYPVTFYPGTTEQAAARPIHLAGGERLQADLQLHAVPALRLTVHTPEPRADKPKTDDSQAQLRQLRISNLMLNQTIFGDQRVTSLPGAAQGEPTTPNVTEFTGLAPGRYTLSGGDASRSMTIDLTSSREVNLESAAPLASLDLDVRMADGSVAPAPLFLTLTSAEDATRQVNSGQPDDKTPAHFDGLAPGTWLLQAKHDNLPLAVVSMRIGSTIAPDNRLVVKEQTRHLAASALLGQGKTSLTGFAQQDGKGKAGVMIVLVPKAPGASFDLFRRDQSDSDGSFLLRDVIPGDYNVVAIQDGWDLAWARPEVNARFLPQATPVTVTAKSGDSMRLPAPVVVQQP